jgi:hypothetical protein
MGDCRTILTPFRGKLSFCLQTSLARSNTLPLRVFAICYLVFAIQTPP